MPITGLGLPYMGSKRKLAPKILTKIMQDNPNTKYIYDLFGGGGSVSFLALQIKGIDTVFYNEFNPAIVALLNYIRDNGITKEMYKWVSREEFKNNIDRDDWYGGFLKCVWSFGSNQKGYLFGKDIEDSKHMLHNIVVDNSKNDIIALKKITNAGFNVDILHDALKDKDIENRRTLIMRIVKNNNGRLDIERLQHLEPLQRLQSLQSLQNLQISNKSYEDVNINTPINETIIYLDPPYANTASYNKTINHNDLKIWIDIMSTKGYRIYLSEYKNTYDLKKVKSFKHISTLSSSSNHEVVENLYSNIIKGSNG